MSFIGPALPPHLMHLLKQQRDEDDETPENKDKPDEPEPDDKEEEDPGAYGPALPPGFQPSAESSSQQPRIIGPTLPPGISLGQPEVDSDSDDEIVGPMPVPADVDQAEYLQQQFELRAERMRNKLADEGKEKAPTRESWMLELPKNRSGLLGLEARSFRRNAGPDRTADTSEWTDTPEEKLRKAQGIKAGGSGGNNSSAAELEAIAIMERDKAMAKRAAKHASKRSSESLLDTHQKALNKKKKEEAEKPKERQMFDREKDLQVNRFDEAQKKAVFNKAKFLDDRFSTGGQKYL